MKIPLYLSCVLLLLAIAPMPYGFYQLLRIVITIVAAISTYNYYCNKQKIWLYIFVSIAILYNPIFPIHLNKEMWLPINLITLAVFIINAFIKKEEKISF